MGFGIGWAIPKFSETEQFGVMINLTHVGLDGYSGAYDDLFLENVKLDVYTPLQSVSIAGLVYRDPDNPSDNIVNLGGKIAVDATASIINWQAGSMLAAGTIGPLGVAIVLIATTAGKAIYDYVADHQQETFGETPGGNSTYRQIWYDRMLDMNPQESTHDSKSHIVFVGLNKNLPKSCGAIKLVLHGDIALGYHIPGNYMYGVKSKTAVEMGLIIPIFAW